MATRYVDPFTRYQSDNLTTLPGAQLWFYETGTDTLKATFKDQFGATPHENPVICDAFGSIPAIWLDGTYKLELKDKNGVLLKAADPFAGDVTGGAFSDWNETVSYNIGDLVTASDGCRYESIVNDNLNNDPASQLNPESWEKVLFTRVYNPNVTYIINDEVRAANGENYQSTVNPNLGNDPTIDNGVNWRLQSLTPVISASAKMNAYNTL